MPYGCLPKSKWIGQADREARSVDKGALMSVCLISSCCLLTSLKVSPPPLPPIEALVSKGNTLIVFREQNLLPLNVRAVMLVLGLRLHSNAGNYALPFPNPSAVSFQSTFFSTSCPKQLYQVARLLFHICFPEELHFKSE